MPLGLISKARSRENLSNTGLSCQIFSGLDACCPAHKVGNVESPGKGGSGIAAQMVSPEGCIGQGLISVVMTMSAQHRGQQASKLQVRTLPGSWNKMHVLFASIHGEEPECGPYA